MTTGHTDTASNAPRFRNGVGAQPLAWESDVVSVERRLLAHLGHQLRTPITHIIGYGELLQEEAAERGQADLLPDLRKICAAAAHLLPLVDAALHPSAIEADAREAVVRDRDLRTGLNAIIGYGELLQEEASARGLVDFLPDLQKICTAAAHLLPLVGAVRDLAKVASGDAVGHAGIRGAVTERPGDRAPDGIAAKPAAGSPDKKAPSVLVVDDDDGNRELLSRRVERLGYTVAVAADGRHALVELAAAPFDLVLLDIVMPEMDGYQVLARLKADAAWRHIPVIVLSALDEVASIVTCIQLGAADYLPKPFEPSLLSARMQSALEKGRRDDNAPAAEHGLTPRESEILRLLAAGHSDRAIAEALFISHLTARTHVTNVLAKLGVNTRTAAAAYAFGHGLV